MTFPSQQRTWHEDVRLIVPDLAVVPFIQERRLKGIRKVAEGSEWGVVRAEASFDDANHLHLALLVEADEHSVALNAGVMATDAVLANVILPEDRPLDEEVEFEGMKLISSGELEWTRSLDPDSAVADILDEHDVSSEAALLFEHARKFRIGLAELNGK